MAEGRYRGTISTLSFLMLQVEEVVRFFVDITRDYRGKKPPKLPLEMSLSNLLFVHFPLVECVKHPKTPSFTLHPLRRLRPDCESGGVRIIHSAQTSSKWLFGALTRNMKFT